MRKAYRLLSPEQKAKHNEANKRWKLRHPEKRAEYKHKHYMRRRGKYLHIERERSYRKLYGIGVQQYDQMLTMQGGRCAICGTNKTDPKPNGRFRFFSVDHCHETNKVRGLLCLACNHLMGRYEKHAYAIGLYLNKAHNHGITA
jgi:hypothetical protein